MTSSYDDIYSIFLSKITDYNFISLNDSDINDMMNGWMLSAISQPYISRLFSDLIVDNRSKTLNFKLKTTTNDFSDINFVQEIIARGMVIEWLEPQVKSVLNTAQMFGGKEQKFFSQSQHLKELKDLLLNTKIELRKLIRDRGYIYNSYLGED